MKIHRVMESPSACRIVVSTPGLAVAAGADYTDLEAALAATSRWGVGSVELVMLPEWAGDRPPLTAYRVNWAACPRYRPGDVIRLARRAAIPVAAVHASRDLGAMLGYSRFEERARRVFGEALAVAVALDAGLIVLHAWDTWARRVDIGRLARTVGECCREAAASGVRVALENIPVSARGQDQVSLLAALTWGQPGNPGLTVDLNWASLGDCFPALSHRLDPVLNVHVQGLAGDELRPAVRPRDGVLDYEAAVTGLRDRGWRGPLTLELTGIRGAEDMDRALRWLRALAGS